MARLVITGYTAPAAAILIGPCRESICRVYQARFEFEEGLPLNLPAGCGGE
ncbi:hypothetical protein QJS04_geneDACA024441 [Acorus gramineus]|uniref:Uncharacterized protein n=1 Tax=Acorus gramineus TaxID=55184 RepID=A0AAV8ZZN5_ACOGR|nr:hypothetical protein QJS04_geneDACA024441 [Acorus gramineus]